MNTKDFMSGMKASLRGAPNGSAKYFWVLVRFCFEAFLRSACLGWLYQTLAAMQDIWVSLHSIRSKINIISSVSSLITSSCNVPFKILLGSLGYWTSSI
jgi:hypothetical protein